MAPLIALSGFMGSGKTTVGSILAKRLGLDFIDLDSAVEEKLATDIGSFFRTHGEDAFRAVESNVLRELITGTTEGGMVLALGGGTLDDPQNRDAIAERFTIAHLRISAGEAWKRVVGSTRPLAQDESSFLELAARRRRVYEESADWLIPTESRDVAEILADLESLVSESPHNQSRRWARRLGGTSRNSVIVGGEGALDVLAGRAEARRTEGSRFLLFTDENVWSTQGEKLLQHLFVDKNSDLYVVAPGEPTKSASVLAMCWDWLAGRKTARDDVVVAFGGGVVGDLAGFVAATYQRGLSLWQVPTSLLAQVDSSVGGKTAINLPLGKNLVGAFHQADLVVVDPAPLMTLPEAEYRGALGEVVKHGLLDSERAFASLETSVGGIALRDARTLGLLVKQNVWYKASVVEEDEREYGKRAVLNLGHTTAHALESSLGYGALSHGQAVAYGLLVALAISEEQLGLSRETRARTRALFEMLGLKTKLQLPDRGQVVAAAALDKKRRAGNSGFVGLRRIGEPVWGIDVSPQQLERALGVIAE